MAGRLSAGERQPKPGRRKQTTNPEVVRPKWTEAVRQTFLTAATREIGTVRSIVAIS